MSAEPAFEFSADRASDGFAAWLDEIGNVESENELFAVLAAQLPPTSKLARQQIRGRLITILKRKLRELESDAAAARTADAWLLEGGEPDDLQGQGFVIEETEPWASVVDGAAMLDEVEALYDAYVLMTQEKRYALAFWTVFSHAFECFGVAPILELTSPTKRCGKSSAVIVSRYLCRATATERKHHPRGAVPGDPGVEANAAGRRGGHLREDARRAPRDPQRWAHARHRIRRPRGGRQQRAAPVLDVGTESRGGHRQAAGHDRGSCDPDLPVAQADNDQQAGRVRLGSSVP
jgi:hypothetical protein